MSSVASGSFVRPREGLGDLPDRLYAQDCTIAYLGASVTAQRDGYRPRFHEALCRATGRSHRSVAAGTGAMGAITGVFLMDELVLRHRPDLCFVEYATSDVAGTTPAAQLGPAIEGIVGKLDDAGCELCFLYLPRTDRPPDETRAVVEAYEQVADRHGVPSLDVAAELAGTAPEGLLRDGVHTTDPGSELVAAAVLRGLERIPSAPRRARAEPLFGDSFRRTEVVAVTRELARHPDRCREARFRLAYPYLELDADNELRFAPEGELIGLVVIVGPDSGWLRVDSGDEPVDYLLWDEHCSYDRLGSVIFTPFSAAGADVSIRLSERPVDYSAARRPVGPGQTARKRLKLVSLMMRL